MFRGDRTADLPVCLDAGWLLHMALLAKVIVYLFFNPKQEKRSLIVQRKVRMVDVEEIFQ